METPLEASESLLKQMVAFAGYRSGVANTMKPSSRNRPELNPAFKRFQALPQPMLSVTLSAFNVASRLSLEQAVHSNLTLALQRPPPNPTAPQQTVVSA